MGRSMPRSIAGSKGEEVCKKSQKSPKTLKFFGFFDDFHGKLGLFTHALKNVEFYF